MEYTYLGRTGLKISRHIDGSLSGFRRITLTSTRCIISSAMLPGQKYGLLLSGWQIKEKFCIPVPATLPPVIWSQHSMKQKKEIFSDWSVSRTSITL